MEKIMIITKSNKNIQCKNHLNNNIICNNIYNFKLIEDYLNLQHEHYAITQYLCKNHFINFFENNIYEFKWAIVSKYEKEVVKILRTECYPKISKIDFLTKGFTYYIVSETSIIH